MFNLKEFNLQKSLFSLIVLLLPTQLVFHFWPDWSIVQGFRVDYFSPSIYLVDIFVILYLVTSLIKGSKKWNFTGKAFIFVVFLVFVNFVFSSLFANSFFQILRLIVYSLFAFLITRLYIDYYCDFLKPLMVSMTFFCLLGVFQFFLQNNVGGLLYFFGERSISVTSLGAPLVEFFGKDYLRVQSTFSHPNSFAGFIVISLVLLWSTTTPNKDRGLKLLFSSLALSALFFSFSKAAFLALIFLIFLAFLYRLSKRYFRYFLVTLPGAFLVLSILFLSASVNLIKREGVYTDSVSQRIVLAEVSHKIIFNNFLFGVGSNNFIFELSKNPPTINSIMFLQPVHNIFLLILSEWGIVGLVFFLMSVYKPVLNKVTPLGIKVSLLTILFLGLFDHYFLTLNQNLFLFIILMFFGSMGDLKEKD